MNRKSGFGLMEVLVAALVLGFMLIGLNILQKGNRESVLRIRARDGANAVAQEVIDSISALGSASVPVDSLWSCKGGANDTLQNSALCKKRTFNNVDVNYNVVVKIDAADEDVQIANEETDFVIAIKNNNSEPFNAIDVEHSIAKQVNVTVKWDFKKTEQSINMSAVIR